MVTLSDGSPAYQFIKAVALTCDSTTSTIAPVNKAKDRAGDEKVRETLCREMMTLPKEIAPIITEYPQRFSDWLAVTGIFDPSFNRCNPLSLSACKTKKEAAEMIHHGSKEAEEIIEISSKLRIKQWYENNKTSIYAARRRRLALIKWALVQCCVLKKADIIASEQHYRMNDLVAALPDRWFNFCIKYKERFCLLQKTAPSISSRNLQLLTKTTTHLWLARLHIKQSATLQPESKAHSATATKALLSLLFNNAYASASEIQKEEISRQTRALLPLREKCALTLQKGFLRISEIAVKILKSEFFKFFVCILLFIAIEFICIYLFYALAPVIIIPIITLINTCSPAAALAIKFLFLIALTTGIAMILIPCVLILEHHTTRVLRLLTHPLEKKITLSKQNHLALQEKKAYDLWIKLIDQAAHDRKTNRSKTN